MLLVSVIMPAYNYGRYLSRAIDSVVRQTFSEFEIIVVDDGSSDETPQVLASYSDARLRSIRHERNRGASAARNSGIRDSQGSLIAFLDSDDEWMPDKLERQVAVLEQQPDLGLVYTGIKVIDAHTNAIIKEIYPQVRGKVFNELLRNNGITGGGSSALIRKECLTVVGGFDETFPDNEDWDMWLRIAKHYPIDYVNQLLVNYYRHGRNASDTPVSIIEGYERLWDKYQLDLAAYPSLYSHHYYELGIRCCDQSFMRRGIAHFLKAFRISPSIHLKVKCILQCLLASLGHRVYSNTKNFLYA